ncbi:hypothetical protein EVAR_89509_1 [Eumeta japonica]|uniref:Uncharacterized protein n=1 Tax=Eumeta variegata TaxID=151549 RepID=A0A4C1Y737_EUMVA|nr:hypothetical protein EVAR_89509_1 [Eumeta japonica]
MKIHTLSYCFEFIIKPSPSQLRRLSRETPHERWSCRKRVVRLFLLLLFFFFSEISPAVSHRARPAPAARRALNQPHIGKTDSSFAAFNVPELFTRTEHS